MSDRIDSLLHRARPNRADDTAGLLGPEHAAPAVAAGLALCDLALGLAGERWNPALVHVWRDWRLALSQSALAAFLLLSFAILWRAARPLVRRGARWRPALLAGVSMLLVATFVPALLQGSDPRDEPTDAAGWLARGLVASLLALVVAPLAARYAAAPEGNGTRRWAGAVLLALPFAALAACLALWFKTVRRLSAGEPAFLCAASLGLVALALLVRAFARSPGWRTPRRWLRGLVAALLAWPLATLALDAAQLVSVRADALERAGPRHVLLLTVDTLRRDALSCYGSENPTPAFDSLARDGVLFTRALAGAAWTQPSVTTILTGLSNSVHHSDTSAHGLVTVAERLRAEGRRTFRVGFNPILSDPLFGRGFVEDGFAHHHPLAATAARGELARRLPALLRWELTTPQIAREAGDWMLAHADEPFFCWVHVFDPHAPLDPPSELLPPGVAPLGGDEDPVRDPYPSEGVNHGPDHPGRELSAADRARVRAFYLTEVRHVDAEVGALFERLRAAGIYDDMLVVFTSDHGEELYDHGDFGHGHSLHGEVLGVPLVFKLPSAEGVAGARVDLPVGGASVAPTLLELAGSKGADGAAFSAPSLAGLCRAAAGAAGELPRAVFSSGLAPRYGSDEIALTSGTMKCIRSDASGRELVFDLARDPDEAVDLAGEERAWLETARGLFELHAAESEAIRQRLGLSKAPPGERSEAAERALRALGYL